MKLTFLECKYHVSKENGTVVARAYFSFCGEKFNTIGVARAKKEDFIPIEGKRLARARAEKKAYILVKNCIKDNIKCIEREKEISINSLNFYTQCIEHQNEYIKTF